MHGNATPVRLAAGTLVWTGVAPDVLWNDTRRQLRRTKVARYVGKAILYGGWTGGVILFALLLEASVNLLPRALASSPTGGNVLAFTLPFVSYLFPSLFAPFCYKAVFPRKWRAFKRQMALEA